MLKIRSPCVSAQTTRLNNSFSASNHTEFEYLCRAVFLDLGCSRHDVLYLLDIQKSFSDVGGNVRSHTRPRDLPDAKYMLADRVYDTG